MTTALEFVNAERRRLRVEREREELAGSLSRFVQAAWHVLKPQIAYRDNWHIKVLCEHLEAVSRGEIKRLQVWVPPGTMKSMNVSIFWPVWEWTRRPGLRYWTASYALDLAWDHNSRSRDLLISEWFQERWPLKMTKAGETGYENDQGGTRTTTAPGSGGLGKHGDRIILDDLLDASEAERLTRTVLEKTNDWYDSVVFGRQLTNAAQVIIMQRLHENDIAAHALEVGDWTVLCLPERFENDHPYRWSGDPRSDGELLWPEHRDETASNEYAHRLGPFRAAGQLQQRPAAREGQVIKRSWWRFYDPKWRDDPKKLPRFTMIVQSWDTPLKDKETSDFVAGQCYGIKGADRYLLDLRKGKMNYSGARRAIKEMSQWSRKMWPHCPNYVLIENAGYGVELITDLKREITGVTKIVPGNDGNKITRAESACDALESGNVFLPGIGPPSVPDMNEAVCSADIVDFVHSLAQFPMGTHDDDVDSWSMAMNWLRNRNVTPLRTSSALKRIVGRV